MTVTSETNKAQATGNGVVKAFAYAFQVTELDWMEVYLNDVLQTSGYTVSGIGNPVGGSVTFTVAPASGVIVTLLRAVPLTQEVDYQPYDPFPAEVAEGTLDKLTMITQQLQEELDRSWKVPIDTPPTADVSPPPYEAGKVIGWSETDQTQLVNYPGIGTFQQLVDDSEAAAAAAAASQSAAAASATSAQGSAVSAANSANSAANAAAAAQVAKMEWRGAWNSSANYEANDVVEYSGSSFVALIANTNVTPVVGATWDLVAQKGDKGDTGASGTGTGDVNGPAVSVDNQVALFSGTSGTLLKAGSVVGNAAYATLTTSTTDATAGRVTKVGDFGLGGDSASMGTTSLDTLLGQGTRFVRVSTAYVVACNAPSGASGGVVQHITFGTVNAAQIYTQIAGGTRQWIRFANTNWGPWVEVWTGSNLVKQTSATDTTAGAMMAVGAFGLGTSILVTNLDTITVSGLFACAGAATGVPIAEAGLVLSMMQTTTIGVQYFISRQSSRMFTRAAQGAGWSGWSEVVRANTSPQFKAVGEVLVNPGLFTTNQTIVPINNAYGAFWPDAANLTITFDVSQIPINTALTFSCTCFNMHVNPVTWRTNAAEPRIYWEGGVLPTFTGGGVLTFLFLNNGGTLQAFGFASGLGMALV